MELRGERVVLRPLAEADVPRIVEIGDRSGGGALVARAQPPETRLEKARGEDDGETFFAILVEGEVAGMIQYYEENERGLPPRRDRPLPRRAVPRAEASATDAVRTMARHLIDDRGHHRLTIDPAAHNERAIRCYEKVGFRPVGVMREYWRDPDGVWRDGLLLDLLAKELT